jgi:hypothetical protein
MPRDTPGPLMILSIASASCLLEGGVCSTAGAARPQRVHRVWQSGEFGDHGKCFATGGCAGPWRVKKPANAKLNANAKKPDHFECCFDQIS